MSFLVSPFDAFHASQRNAAILPELDKVVLLERDETSDVESNADVVYTRNVESSGISQIDQVFEYEDEEVIEIEEVLPTTRAQLRKDGHLPKYSPLPCHHHDREIHLPTGFYQQPELHRNPQGCEGGCNQYCDHCSSAGGRFDLLLLFFSLFFTSPIFSILATNTNAYAALHSAKSFGCEWIDVEASELKIWLALVIYMSVFKHSRPAEYWQRHSDWLLHLITQFMGQTRFEQIKRYFHISPPGGVAKSIFDKLEPLASHL